MIDQNNLAKNLIGVLKLHGVTTAKLSQDINIPEITINKIRNGQNQNPTISTLLPIVKYFNISLDYLFRSDHGESEVSMPVLNMDGSIADDVLNLGKYFDHVDFVIKMGCDNYPGYKKGSLLLVRNQGAANEDLVVVKLNNYFTPCQIVIEGGVATCKSLIYSDKYYQINITDILGVVVGAIWKRN